MDRLLISAYTASAISWLEHINVYLETASYLAAIIGTVVYLWTVFRRRR